MAPRIVLQEGPPGEQIKSQISGLIATNELPAGALLPSVRQLARDLGVAAGTVASAYRDLQAQGLIVLRRGSGTRVADGTTPVPQPVVEKIRQLVTVSHENNVALDDLTHVLHTLWKKNPYPGSGDS